MYNLINISWKQYYGNKCPLASHHVPQVSNGHKENFNHLYKETDEEEVQVIMDKSLIMYQFTNFMLLFCPSWSCTIICIILHYNMYYFHFILQEPC